MSTVEVLVGGLHCSVQDLGRPGFRAAGVPAGGAMDRFALSAANLLVGNAAEAAGLEILLGGLTLKFHAAVTICVAGADLGARLDGVDIGMWAPLTVHGGQVLQFTGRRSGSRAYLSVAGGVDVAPVLRSRSTYLPGGWGGFQGRPLEAGDKLAVGDARAPSSVRRWLPPENRPAYSGFPTLRSVAGPHTEHFSVDALETFFAGVYRLEPASDRMGYRLAGPALRDDRREALASSGVLPGAVQVPASGGPILLMADAQTTGGYPIVAVVIGADLPLAAQLIPGDRLRFAPVTVEAAQRAARARQADLAALLEDEDVACAPV
jgi:antagonist of KipI